MKKKSWRTSSVAGALVVLAGFCLHWHLGHHPGKWFFDEGEIHDFAPEISLLATAILGWHAKDKQADRNAGNGAGGPQDQKDNTPKL